MKVFQQIHYEKDIWFVRTNEWREMLVWLWDNEIDFTQECWTNTGVGFRLTGDDKDKDLTLLLLCFY